MKAYALTAAGHPATLVDPGDEVIAFVPATPPRTIGKLVVTVG